VSTFACTETTPLRPSGEDELALHFIGRDGKMEGPRCCREVQAQGTAPLETIGALGSGRCAGQEAKKTRQDKDLFQA